MSENIENNTQVKEETAEPVVEETEEEKKD